MDKYRLLIISDETGENESVYFLDALNNDDAGDYCAPNQTVTADTVIAADLPLGFPTEYELKRS